MFGFCSPEVPPRCLPRSVAAGFVHCAQEAVRLKVVVDADESRVTVEGADELSTLSVELRGCAPEDATDLLGSLGRVDGLYAWLDIELLRARLEPPRRPDWTDRFDGAMVYARTKGWMDPTGRYVRAHISQPYLEGTDEAR